MKKCISNTYGEFNDNQHIGPAVWPHFDLIFIHDGHVSITLMGKETIELYTGQSILIYPNTSFAGHSISPTTSVSVHHFTTINTKHKTDNFELFLHTPPAELKKDITRAVEFSQHNPSLLLDETRYTLMRFIIAQLRMNEEEPPAPTYESTEFKPLIEWLQTKINKSINLSDMASRTNYSESHFRTRFKEQLGISPGTYFLNMRMKKAAILLRETVTPIKEVATKVGYNELTHFYRAFTTHHHIAPATYRKKHLPRG